MEKWHNRQTNGHRTLETEPAQWADSVEIIFYRNSNVGMSDDGDRNMCVFVNG